MHGDTHATDHQRQQRRKKRSEKKIFCLCFRNFLVQQMTEITVYCKRYYHKR